MTTTGDDWIRVQADGITGGTDILTAPYPGIPNRPPAANRRIPVDVSGHERRRRVDFQRPLFVRERTRAHGRGRQGRDGEQRRRDQGRGNSFPARRSKRRTFEPARGSSSRGWRPPGETEIIGLEYIDRGYERLEELLSELGGQVQRSSGVTPLVEPSGFFETSEYPRVSAAG